MLSRFYALIVLLICVTDVLAETPIVYSRCERTTATYELSGTVTISGQPQTLSRTMTGIDVYDVLPDVTNFFTGFSAPCDLIYRNSVGVETVIYDCSTTSTMGSSCAALDPAVSFDGNTIAFSVFRGSLENHLEWVDSTVLHPDAEPGNLGWHTLPNKKLVSTGAHLHFYTVGNGSTSSIPFQAGIYDSGPAFISNTRIAFTSTRDGHTPTVVWGTTSSKNGTRIWSMDIDGKNLDLSSHHSLSQEQHPFMLKDGRLAYSSWQIFGGLPFRYGNGAAGNFTTLDNLFHIYAQDPDGAGNFPIYGQHSGDHLNSYFGEEHSAAHFITQTSDTRVWFADYYRGNNNGLGVLVGVIPEPKGQEGISPYLASSLADIYVPNDAINFAAWATNSDQTSKTLISPAINHPSYTDPIPWAGKVGHPAALPSNGLMLVWGKGACSTVVSSQVYTDLALPVPPSTDGYGSGIAMNNVTSLGMDIPGCDAGLYKATVIPSTHPSDMTLIVDSPNWHEIMARAVVPYTDIHGVAQPTIIERSDIRTTHSSLVTGTPFGLLGAASITDRETAPREGITFAGEHQFNLQGTDTIDYVDDDLCGVRILGILPNRSVNTYNDIANYAGERVSILGEVSVLNRDTGGNRVIDPSTNPDTSFLVRMPANMPYLMQGIDCDGRTLNTDQTWQSLRPGEVKTCGGCHVHSKASRIQFNQSFASTANYTIPAFGEGSVPLLTGLTGNTVNTRSVAGYGMRIEFTRDIKPIFDAHCISCHGGGTPAAGLALDVTSGANNVTNTTWWCLVADRAQSCVAPGNQMNTGYGTIFRRPQMTRYIRAFNSRGSLLYWKAANQRTDNRTDGQYADDIDFGAAHPTTITADELGLLSRWIDIGAPGGSSELLDTHKPTVHLAATVSGGGITHLHVGTVDLGSGINTASLAVSINGGANIAPAAEPHGVVTIALGAAITNPADEITVSVSDLESPANTTTIVRTASYYLDGGTSTVSISAGGNEAITEGNTFSRTISFTDGDDTNSDGWTVDIDWCGTPENGVTVAAGQSSFNISRLFPSAGSCLVTVTITDGVGETDSGSFTITINSAGTPSPLSISAGSRAFADEGNTFSRVVSINDGEDSGADGWSYTADWGSLGTTTGTIPPGSNAFTISKLMVDGNRKAIHKVVVTVTDTSSGSDIASDSFQLIVRDVARKGTVTGSGAIAINQPYTVTVNSSDPGSDVVVAYIVDWGDGNQNGLTTHTYTTPGTYKVVVWTVDEEDMYRIGAHLVVVSP